MPGSLSEAIRGARRAGRLPVMADIKPVSPRDGDLLRGRRPGDLAAALADAGVCALSVVTEPVHFGGSLETLAEVVAAVDLPVLRKDFIERVEQVDETSACGAAAVLLTVATIPPPMLPVLYARATAVGLEAVVEVHTEDELRRALALEPSIVGINNRDLLDLERDDGDVSVTERLMPRVPAGVTTLSESSLSTSDDIRRALAAGAGAVLVGTALLESDDVGRRLRELAGGAGGAAP